MKKFDGKNQVKHQTLRPYSQTLEGEVQKEFHIAIDQNLDRTNLDRERKISTVIIVQERSLQEELLSTKGRY